MSAYLKTAPTGVPGDISRPDSAVVEPVMLIPVSSVYAQAFGIPMAYVAGGVSQWGTSNVSTDFAGILVREVPSMSGSSSANQGLTSGIPLSTQVQGLLVRGYINVLCTVGTPVRGGAVYVRVVAAGGKLVGDLEATADGSNNLALVGVSWATDGKDASNNAEIRLGHG